MCSLTSVRDLLHATKSMYVKTVVLLNVDKLVVDSGDAAAAAVPEESGIVVDDAGVKEYENRDKRFFFDGG